MDIRFALRLARRQPAFTLAVVLTLALGIGANAAIFSIVDAVLLQPLPFSNPDRLVRVTGELAKVGIPDAGLAVLEMDALKDTGVFDSVAGIYPINANLTGSGGDFRPERIEAQLVSENYFELLGVTPAAGRLFTSADHFPGNGTIAVISDSLAERHFHGVSPLGQAVRIDDDLYTIVGVLPADFRHPGAKVSSEPEFFTPSGYSATPFPQPRWGNQVIGGGAIARLKPGVSIQRARAALTALGDKIRRDHSAEYPERLGWAPRLIPLKEDVIGDVSRSLMIFMAAVAAVLLIACANVANLLLARATGRQREIAVRLAIGATRGRVVSQMLTESIVLSIAGGAAGLAVAGGLTRALLALAPAELPRVSGVGIDWRVLLFTFGLSALTGVLFGLWPALRASRSSLQSALAEQSRSATASAATTRVRGALIAAEFAIALVLLVSATLLIRSFVKLYDLPPGFQQHNVLTARLWMPVPNDPTKGVYLKPDARAQLFVKTVDTIERVPGVARAAWVSRIPLVGRSGSSRFLIEGQAPELALVNNAEATLASPGYFEVMGIPLVEGRDLNEHDDAKGAQVAIVSKSFARKYLGDGPAIGRRVRLGGPQSNAPFMEIVGVVGDVRSVQLESDPLPQLYRPAAQQSGLSMALVVRTKGDSAALAEPVRAAFQSVDRELPLYRMEPMESVLSAALASRRFALVILTVFAGLALLLSAVGIYSVMAYSVQQRTSEIGIRRAFGATSPGIVFLVLRQGLTLASIGIAIGLAASAFAARALSSSLFGIEPLDPLTFAGITVALFATAIAACLLPARRAVSVSPMTALK